jgi:hypothetical protein
MPNIDTLIAGCKLHKDNVIEWTIIYLLRNPKTDYECSVFNKEFEALFPESDAIDTLETLYRQGIANKHAMREYYIDKTSIDIMDSRIRIFQFQGFPDNTPIWDF